MKLLQGTQSQEYCGEGDLVHAQALISFLSLRNQEETRPQVIQENMTPGSSKTKIVKTEECFCGNKEYTMWGWQLLKWPQTNILEQTDVESAGRESL